MAERLVDKHIEKIRRLHPEAFGPAGGAEEGNVLPNEVVVRSSKKPVTISPLLGVTPADLYKHRSDTHTRIAHSVSNFIAHGTGFVDGLADSLANGTAEIIEDVAFFTSKTIHGAKHGWSRGKFQ